jgi:hypothetical protein
MVVPTLLDGQNVIVDLSSSSGVVKINDSNVVTADVLATNGVIHVIDAVLVPPSIDVVAFLKLVMAVHRRHLLTFHLQQLMLVYSIH